MITSLQTGHLIGYFEQGRFVFGQVTEASTHPLGIITSDGKKLLLPPNRIVICSNEALPSTTEGFQLADFESEVKHKKDDIDFGLLIKNLDYSKRDYSLDELTAALFGFAEDTNRFSVFLALREQPEYFLADGIVYHLRTEPERAAYLQRAEEKRQQQLYHAVVSNWFIILFPKQNTNHEQPQFPTFPAEYRHRFEDDLYQHLTGKSLPWLKKALRAQRDTYSHEKQIVTIRLALGQINPDTVPRIAVSGLPVLFDKELTALAEGISGYAPDPCYQDLTSLPCFTVDDASTPDADDALSVIKTDYGWQLGVHIVMASEYFPADSPLETEACRRTSSIYTTGESVFMLPERICCDLASLLPGTIRPALSLLFCLTDDGEILSHSVSIANIKIHRRLSYEELDAQLFCSPPASELAILLRFATRHLQMRLKDGAIVPDDLGICSSRRLVAECMVAYNHLMAEKAQNAGIPFIYRCLEDAVIYDADREIRFIPHSVYTILPTNHQAMGLDVYAHLTSPLRRYADMVNQRQILALLCDKPSIYDKVCLIELIPHLNKVRAIIRQI